ncbi:MarR family transcriptional regulator [Selenomonas ruminantium]|uniref:Uncharacterized protein n=1 Tax=Selenomonas ruminantium TaxID=971 RepID=A0A1I0WJ48_SELRU|nr:MarR family transcriptional regulator [Selenomonas ruminantium]SFA88779.1 hypothetical protein SAMN05216587_10339 [Selenomonas ruminantium]
MGTDLTPKAEKLLAYIQKAGGGVLDEWYIRDKTGLSHGTICAARKELVEKGLLRLGKEMRKMTYQLVDLTGQLPKGDKAAPITSLTALPQQVAPPPPAKAVLAPVVKSPAQPKKKPAPKPANVQEAIMPRVTGDFADFDDWLMALNNEFGGCVDVSQSLVSADEYTVFSPDYEGEDSYTVTENEDGGITVD